MDIILYMLLYKRNQLATHVFSILCVFKIWKREFMGDYERKNYHINDMKVIL